MGMAVESGGHGIAIEWLLKTARSQEGKDWGGFASDGIANGGIMEHGNALGRAQFRERRFIPASLLHQ